MKKPLVWLFVLAAVLPNIARPGNLPGALSVLPPDVDLLIGIDLSEGLQAEAIFRSSLVLEAEHSSNVPLSESGVWGAAARVGSEAGSRLSLHTYVIAERTKSGASGGRYAVLLGDFGESAAKEFLQTKRPDSETKGMMGFGAESPGGFWAFVPLNGMLVLTNDESWPEQLEELSQQRKGLLAPNSRLNAAITTFSGRIPSVLFYCGEGVLDAASANRPEWMVALGPFFEPARRANSIVLAEFAKPQRTVEMHLQFDSTDAALQASLAWRQVTVYLAQQQRDLTQSPAVSPAERESLEALSAALVGTEAKVVTKSMVVEIREPSGSAAASLRESVASLWRDPESFFPARPAE